MRKTKIHPADYPAVPMTMQFLQDGKELESHPDEAHHQIVVHLEGMADVPIMVAELPISTTCEDMKPDGHGGSVAARTAHLNAETMAYLGKIMGHSLEMYEALRDLMALSYGGVREGLDADEISSTMRARIENALPDFKSP